MMLANRWPHLVMLALIWMHSQRTKIVNWPLLIHCYNFDCFDCKRFEHATVLHRMPTAMSWNTVEVWFGYVPIAASNIMSLKISLAIAETVECPHSRKSSTLKEGREK